ncbi:MAG: hypothetical protein ACI8WB_000698, partial [Phenylobacterium sp.]
QLRRAKICSSQGPQVSITPGPDDDTGLLVQQAFSDGAKHVHVDWGTDGLDRHWNTIVGMPAGGTLSIYGPSASVAVRGGAVRSGYSSYVNGKNGGTAALASPMIFKNLRPSPTSFPYDSHAKVYDQVSLISMTGNNIVLFGDGTYVHDQGGMCAHANGCALIDMVSYAYDMPCSILGGGHHCQFYLSGPLLNHRGGTSTCEIRLMQSYFIKLSSDGPVLTADKGFRRLMDKGVAGVTAAMLNVQPWEVPESQAQLNDNLHPGSAYAWLLEARGPTDQTATPRMVSITTWSHGSGWALVQISAGFGEISSYGMIAIEGTNLYMSLR